MHACAGYRVLRVTAKVVGVFEASPEHVYTECIFEVFFTYIKVPSDSLFLDSLWALKADTVLEGIQLDLFAEVRWCVVIYQRWVLEPADHAAILNASLIIAISQYEFSCLGGAALWDEGSPAGVYRLVYIGGGYR
jgi:hypothetical protein